MLTHVIYTEVLNTIDVKYCARMPKAEVERQIGLMLSEIAAEKKIFMPEWEYQVLATQLIYDLPYRHIS